jgi:hypothetical protein
MAINLVTTTMVAGVEYTYTTDSSADWVSISNDTYFYDLTDKKVYYKNSNGAVLNQFSSVCFSPQDVGDCDTAPTGATTQYYYQTISQVTGTINRAKVWGFSGSDVILFGLYRGTLSGTLTLIGQGTAVCGIGPNVINLSPETGQNLDLSVGEDIVVGIYASGISWRTIYDDGISDIAFGISNTTNITTMPTSPTGTASSVRFACTLYS